MSTIRAATSSDLDAVSCYVAGAFKSEPARYRRFLEYTWLTNKPDLGVLIEEDNRIRGFIGAIYSDRRHAGEIRRFCNLTSIAVDESHRKLTLQLFNAMFRQKQLTFTCFSASERIAKILDFFRFVRGSSDKVVVGPVSGLGGLRRLFGAPPVRVVTDVATLESELPATECQIVRDHRPYRCGIILLIRGDRRCLAVTARRGRGVRAFADVLYATDPMMLLEYLPWIHVPLFRAHGTVLTGVDRRWISKPPRVSFVYSRLRPVYMRSPTLGIEDVDALYSELVTSSGLR